MRRVRRHLAAIAFFAVAAIVMTWPLAANLPLAAAHPGDPSITAWMLDWAFYALTHHPTRLFHANIFHPLPYSFAFSENLLGIVLVLAPLLAMKLPLLVIHNLAILLGFAGAGYGAALLGRHITGSMLAGVVGGFFFAFVPWRFTHLTHLQHLWTVWLPLLILAVLRLRERPTNGRAAVLVLCFVMNGLTNLHWLAFGSVAAVVTVMIATSSRAFFLRAVAALAIGSVLLAPMLYPYWRARELYNMRGDAQETLHYSAVPSDWLISSLHNRVYGPHLNDGTVDPERWSFPGVLGPLLALMGAVAMFRRSRVAVLTGLALIVLGFAGSLGLYTAFGRLLFDYVPLFKGIRVPARWAMIAYLGIAMLASCGALAIARRRWTYVVLLALFFVELRAAPIRWYLTTGDEPPVYAWLARQKLQGAVLELPADQASTYPYLFWSHIHHQPLINGVSGFKPPDNVALEAHWTFEQFLRRGGSVIIAHQPDPALPGPLVKVAVIGTDTVYATPAQARTLTPPPAVRPAIDGALLHPVHWEEITGPLDVRGTTNARQAILWFENRRTRIDVDVRYGHFTHTFPVRPSSIRADTDLQVELIDANGRRRRLPQVWLRWRRPGEKLNEGPLPQTADLGAYKTLLPNVSHKSRPSP
jgi:hypothetical protein